MCKDTQSFLTDKFFLSFFLKKVIQLLFSKKYNTYLYNQMEQRVINIQNWLNANKYAACIIPQADPHQSEYIEDHYKLRAYISGFTGSAGTLVITTCKAALFTDSRYHIQASIQLEGTGIELFKSGIPGIPTYKEWLKQEVGEKAVTANAMLFSINEWASIKTYINIEDNCDFEQVWENRPALCPSKVFIHNTKYSGESTESKIERIRSIIRDNNADIAIACNLDDIAWLLNIRGGDVAHNPVVRSYVAIEKEHCLIFVDSNKLTEEVCDYLTSCGVTAVKYTDIDNYLIDKQGCRILFDKGSLNQHLYEIIEKNNTPVNQPLYISRQRAIKNNVEIEGYRESMLKDGIMWVKFYKWFHSAMQNGSSVTEISVMDKIRELKQEQKEYIDESFGTIAGYGEHGAIGHYAATPESNAKIENHGLLVIDTGTHYLTGTTDTTRTIVCGTLTDEERRDYTLVLKGHIALGTAIFPKGTKGSQLDILARQYLWQNGLNYGHGTGHGVGHLLNVHEGYAWLRPSENGIEYQAGLTMTDEPGIYREGKHGVRIENTVLVTPYLKTEFGEFLTFEHLTLAPYEMQAIDTSLLTLTEKNFINNYNKRLQDTLKPHLSQDEFEYLKTITYEL